MKASLAGKASFVLVLAALACLPAATTASATPVQPNFVESVVFSGLTNPTAIRFASDGRIFVAEKGGLIKEFDSLGDTTPTVVADLRTEVDDYWDRGLLSIALDPSFPTSSFLYALYTFDAPIGGTAPTWNDACPSPPGPTTDGCVVSGKLVRLTLSGSVATAQTVLIKDQWCQQYPSHSIGDLRFGTDGALYVSGGEGANFAAIDIGQGGGSPGSPTPKNPCGDPPGGVGGSMTAPTARGGALRSQSLRRPAGEPVLLNGAVLRVDPATGNARPDNPLASSTDPNARRIVAYGFRNPFRFTLRPGTNELWVADVGWDSWEEIDRSVTPTSSVLNFGWPCYEGLVAAAGGSYGGFDLCTSLFTAGTASAPYYTYSHSSPVVSGDNCPTGGGSSTTGITFYTGGNYPSSYNGALFFADYARQCIWYMPTGANGLPDPTQIKPFVVPAASPVDLEIGPNGDLFYADLNGGTIRRIVYTGGANNPPVAVASANPTSGTAPLTVAFDGSGSSDPDPGDTLSYSWDLNGDGAFGDSTVVSPSYTFASQGTFSVRLRVTDSHGASTVSAPVSISVLAGGGGSSTFGTTVPGSSVDTAGADLKEVSQYTAPQAGNVVKLTGYVSGLGATSGSQPVRAVMYANAGGSPGALLGVSNAVSVAAGQQWGWVDFTFPSPVAVSAGLVWMGYIAGAPNDLTQLRYDPNPGELRYNANPGGYAVGPSDPFGSTITSTMHYSLYATYTGGGTPNNPPVAVASANPTSGTAPLTVAFDGSGSSDPDPGDTLSYSWDLNGDGAFGDSTVVSPSYTFASQGTFSVRLRVTDSHGASTVSAPVSISVLAGGGGSSTFGTTVPGSSVDTAGADLKEVSQYTAPQAGNVVKLTGYVSGLGATSGSQPVRAVMYANAGGSPGALLGVSNAVSVAAGQQWGWVDFTFPSPVAVSAGLVWMGYIAGAPNDLTQLRYDPNPGELRYNANPGGYAVGPSDPFGSTITSTMHYSLYATYTSGTTNAPPVPTISTPSSSLTWKVGDSIGFSGAATDPEDGAVPVSKLTWALVLHHCPDGVNCHLHPVQTWSGIASGSFNAPDHEYPSWIELQLTATDSQGLSATTSVTLQPQTVNLTLQSQPAGLQLTAGSSSGPTPFTKTVIVGSATSIGAASPQTLGGTTYTFSSWSDGGSQIHNIVAPATATTYTATFTAQGGGTNNPPVAAATAAPTSGAAPLAVQFDGSGSSDPDAGDTITYSWDLNGDGTYGDSTAAKPSFTYTQAGTATVRLKVTDSHGASTLSAPITITVTTSVFGTIVPGTLVDSATANLKEVSKFTAPASVNVTKVTAYISGLGSTGGSQTVRVIVYGNTNGNPGSRLGISNQVTVAAGKAWGWVDFTFPSAVSVPAGTVWIGFIAGTKSDLMQMRYSTVSGDLRYNANSYSSGASNPFGSALQDNFHYSLYATY